MILFNYLTRQVLVSTTAVAVILLLIVTSGRLAKYLAQASSGEYGPNLILWIILYRIPDFLPLILPLSLFIGILLSYGRMYAESEMTVLKACGVSQLKLLTITLFPATLIALIVAGLTLWVAPASLYKAQELLAESKESLETLFLRPGKFQTIQDSSGVIYVESFDLDKGLQEIFYVGSVNMNQGLQILRAESGEIGPEADGFRSIVFKNGRVYTEDYINNDYSLLDFERYNDKLVIQSNKEDLKLKLDALATTDLMGSNLPEHHATLHWRFSLPFSVIVVSIIALWLSKTNRRRGRYTKMLPAIVMYLLYILLLSAVRGIAESGETSILFLWVVHIIVAMVVLLFMFRVELTGWLKPTVKQT